MTEARPGPVTRPAPGRLSVIVPVWNEADTLEALVDALRPVCRESAGECEVVFVDDGSTDHTLASLRRLREAWPAIRVVELSRNFGQEAAIAAGLDAASGDVVVVMDGDLQHPPELLPQMLARWREGADAVYAVRRSWAGEGRVLRAVKKLYYRLLSRISDTPLVPGAGNFRLMDRSVVEAMKRLDERSRYLKGLYAWVGFRTEGIEYDPPRREVGASKWRVRDLLGLGLRGITSFSTAPLRWATGMGLVVALASFLYALWVVGETLVFGRDVPGWATIVVLVLFLGGVQLVAIGLLGEYLAGVVAEVKHRPLYLVRSRIGFEGQDPGPPAAAGPSVGGRQG